MRERVLVVGSGAMACLFAARLADSGLDVGMLAGWPENLKALQKHGVCLVDGDSRSCFGVDASDDPMEFQNTEFALVLVKSWQTGNAAHKLSLCLAAHGLALTLQNGMGNQETLAAELGPDRSAAGVTTLGATLLEPGIVQPFSSGEVVLGKHPRLNGIAEMLRGAGFRVSEEEDLRSLLWGKLLVNAAINPVTALLRVPNGFLLENAEAKALAAELALETGAVAKALQIPLPYPDPVARVMQVAEQTSGNRSSMLQDVLRGSPTEIDAITGALLKAAEQAGVPVPANRTVYRLVKALVEKQQALKI